ncbi:staphylopine uptake ABC transporter ATP-binding protein CntD [Paenibacillus sp. CAU 1782]
MKDLVVSKLRISDSRSGATLVSNSSFTIPEGKCLAIAGESGSGKSLTCRAIMRLNKAGLRQSGDILLGDVNLTALTEKEMRRRRGSQLCMILQNGMRAFDPSFRIGDFLRETLSWHYGWGRSDMMSKMAKAMAAVKLNDPLRIMNSYPHQLSGGMLQRTMIALAIVLEPDVVIADEPTTALDTLSQYEVLQQFALLRERIGCAMLFVSHDLGCVKKLADEVIIMRNGVIVEKGASGDIFNAPRHEYTRYLVTSKDSVNQHFRDLMGGDSFVHH